MNREEFIESVHDLKIDITEDMLNKLDIYLEFLLKYNAHTNLTAIKTPEEVYLKHFYDSLTIVKVIDLNKETNLLDIGSGAGFPGMVLKIFYPHLFVTLIDSNNKKTKFLEELKEKICVNNCEVINERVEVFAKTNLNSFDIVTARAVTNMPVLTELAMPLVKKNKYFITLKGSNKEEIESGKYAIEKMHGVINNIANFTLPKDGGERTIISVLKTQETNANVLRTYDKIIKKPLQKSNK